MAQARALGVTTLLRHGRLVWQELLRGRLGGRALWHPLHRLLVLVYLVVRGFIANRGPTRAAALSYTTLLALVPLLAVMLSVSKNFLKESSAEFVPKLIDRTVGLVAPDLELMPTPADASGAPATRPAGASSQARAETVARIQGFIDSIDAGALGTVGTLFLVVIAIRLMTTIESTFNDIWGVTQGRSIIRKVVYYWSTVTLAPLLILLAIYLTGKIEYMKAYGEWLVGVAWVKRLGLSLAPYVVLWLAFTTMYALMPNTQVRLRAAFVGGLVGGTLWQLNSQLSTLYVSRVVTYSKIYGTLGVIPIFLAGLYFSWLVVLFGAQVSCAAQNVQAFLQQRASERFDQAQRELSACRVVLAACQPFLRGQPPPHVADLAKDLDLPRPLLHQLVQRLTEAGVLSEVAGETPALVPARAPDSITVVDVLHVMRSGAGAAAPARADTGGPLPQILADLRAAERTTSANPSFAKLAGQGEVAT